MEEKFEKKFQQMEIKFDKIEKRLKEQMNDVRAKMLNSFLDIPDSDAQNEKFDEQNKKFDEKFDFLEAALSMTNDRIINRLERLLEQTGVVQTQTE